MTELRRTIDAVWRIESAKLVACLARMVRDVGRRPATVDEARELLALRGRGA